MTPADPSDPTDPLDPLDPAQVAPVLRATLQQAGLGGLGDLLARLPGVRVTPAVPKGFLRAALPSATWVGEEHRLVLVEPVRHEHTVRGVVLAHDTVALGGLPDLLARLLVPVLRESAGQEEAQLALTAAREVFGET